MALRAGSKLGPYEILEPIGHGGMGEVYRARDPKLKRDVAVKVLPADFAEDAERMKRFEREAQVLASLNHPHIASIYGLENPQPERSAQRSGVAEREVVGVGPHDTKGCHALILELVEGPTLADRIAEGPLSVEDALVIAKQIAEAVEYAHENGVIHRDLKPANVKLTPDGEVKVLDFGLAKALGDEETLSPDDSLSPTLTRATQAGVLLGTAGYMAPEQAKGKPIDKRADIWAFGVVLFELLTGKRLYSGETASETLALVMTQEPNWEQLPEDTPAHVRHLLRRCLTRDPKERLRDIGEARIALGRPVEESATVSVGAPASPRWRRALPWAVAGLFGIALAVFVPTSRTPQTPLRLSAEIGADASLYMDYGPALALSPDGSILAFTATGADDGRSRVYLRSLDRVEATPLSGTEGAQDPFFSPDGQWIGFFADGKLKKIPSTGGAAVSLADAPNPAGGSWSEDGTIVFASRRQVLNRVSAGGGVTEPLTRLDENEIAHASPQILPGGDFVLFDAVGSGVNFNDAHIVLYSMRDGTRRIVHRGGYRPRYLASGYLLYVRESTLFAMPFDPSRPELAGTPFPVQSDVVSSSLGGTGQFALSDAGTLAYVAGEEVDMDRGYLDWLHRDGTRERLRSEPGDYLDLEFSPDGTRLALTLEQQYLEVWIYDWTRDTMSRLTFQESDTGWPLWSPDGRRIVFSSDIGNSGSGSHDLYWTRADGSGDVERLVQSSQSQVAFSWHPNGELLAYEHGGLNSAGSDVLLLPIEGDESSGWTVGEPMPVLDDASYRERQPAFSYDGQWLAYTSDESGRFEVYVRPFPDVSAKWPISTDGGTYPTWSRTRSELFFFHPSGRIMVASYTVVDGEFRAGKPEVWSEAARLNFARNSRDYALHPDGDRFAVFVPQYDVETNHVTFIFNFFDELERLAPTE